MDEAKVREVFSDEEFVRSLMELETPEEVRNALNEKGIDLSIDKIKELAKIIQKSANGELSDEELRIISGGDFIDFSLPPYFWNFARPRQFEQRISW